MIHRAAQHHHRRLRHAIHQLRAVIISRGGIPTSALPRWREVRKWEMRLKVRIQLFEMVFLAHGVVISTNVTLVIISVIRVCTHALKATRAWLPNSVAVFVFNKHRAVLRDVEGIVVFSDIRSNQVAAEFRWGVRIHRYVLLSHLRANRRPPYPRPLQENP